jgi:hypothetical protein
MYKLCVVRDIEIRVDNSIVRNRFIEQHNCISDIAITYLNFDNL